MPKEEFTVRITDPKVSKGLQKYMEEKKWSKNASVNVLLETKLSELGMC